MKSRRKRELAPESPVNVTWSTKGLSFFIDPISFRADGSSCPIFNDTAGCTFAFVEDYGDDLGFLSDTCALVIREGRINLNETADEIESTLFLKLVSLIF